VSCTPEIEASNIDTDGSDNITCSKKKIVTVPTTNNMIVIDTNKSNINKLNFKSEKVL